MTNDEQEIRQAAPARRNLAVLAAKIMRSGIRCVEYGKYLSPALLSFTLARSAHYFCSSFVLDSPQPHLGLTPSGRVACATRPPALTAVGRVRHSYFTQAPPALAMAIWSGGRKFLKRDLSMAFM